MKKVFLFLLCAALFTSCHDTLIDDNTVQDEPTLVTNKVSYEDALKNLNEVLDELDGSGLRSGGKRRVASHYTVGEYAETRSAGSNEEPFMHVFNFEDEQGFALVSGDARTTPVFAITDTGNLTENTVIEEPAFASLLLNAERLYLEEVELDKMPISSSDGNGTVSYKYSNWTNEYYKLDGTIMAWGQRSPYNDMAPLISGSRAVSGCVATAVAQLCAFHKYPASYNGYSFNWNEIVKHRNNASPAFDYTPAYTQIARFFERISISSNLNMNFGVDASGASMDNVPKTLKNLGFSNGGTYAEYNTSTVLSELKKGYPVIAVGYAFETVAKTQILGITINTKTSYSSGHAWLIDGGMDRERVVERYVDGIRTSATVESSSLVRCNWGWDGSFNGYYYSGIFNPTAGAVLKSGEDNNYQYNQKVVYNIRK